jgi:NAD(P)-dependent dehydrogenase (short-subunit alcohol dehydrogenase family)
MKSLAGKRAVVTGAAMGIGQSIALTLAEQGAAVAVHHRPQSSPTDTLAQLKKFGINTVPIEADLREVSECRRLIAEAVDDLGGLDILVNNAGVTQSIAFEDTTPENFDELFHLNVRGYFVCAQAAVRHLRDAGGGSIVNITSVHGAGGLPLHSAYSATKGAINAWTKAIAIELAPLKIRVNAVGPGLIEVPRYHDIPGYDADIFGARVPLGRVGYPVDVAPLVTFLASNASDFVTGQVIYVDGGTTARIALSLEDPTGSGQ